MVPVRSSVGTWARIAVLAVIVTSIPIAEASDGRGPMQHSPTNPAGQSQTADEAAFLAENDAAMRKMMDGMSVTPSGDIDRDFVGMMIPHHQGAIDMAVAVLRYGRNEQIRRLAQEIIVTQQQEIAAMKLAIGDALPPSHAAPTEAAPSPGDQPANHR